MLSALFLTAALFVGINRAVQASSTLDWWLPLVLLIVGLLLVAADWFEGRAGRQPAEQLVTPSIRSQARVWDDLARLEGIGPKMASALAAAGIDSFERLSHTSEDEIRAAIRAAGLRFAPSLPTWPQQAAYAARGDWDGLAAYQQTLVGGRKA
jgi:predicted flap endonuclease-1-like 5' DNA nuclease